MSIIGNALNNWLKTDVSVMHSCGCGQSVALLSQVDPSIKCDPTNFAKDFNDVFAEIMQDAERGDFNYTPEELTEKRDCLFGYLRDYIAFANADPDTNLPPTDEQVNDLFDKTIKMIDGAIEARNLQRDDVLEQKSTIEEMLADSIEWDDDTLEVTKGEETAWIREYLGKIEAINETVSGLEDDKRMLGNLKTLCVKATDRFSKAICIEQFVSKTHTRGPYLSTSCGFPMPEQILEFETDTHTIQDLGVPASEITASVLRCIGNKYTINSPWLKPIL